MDPFHFEYDPTMGYTDSSNTGTGLTFQGQQLYDVCNDYKSYSSQPHNEYAPSRSRHAVSAGSGADLGAVGIGQDMSLGIMNMNTNNCMGMNMNMNMYTNPIGDMRDMTSGTSYDDFGGTTFNVQSYLSPPHTMVSHEFRSAVPYSDTTVPTGVSSASGTRPIAIPTPRHHFRSAPQFALSPSVQSSPSEHPWFSNYYSGSPAASASSMSYQSDDFARRTFKPVNSSQPIPVSPSPSTPYSDPSPASQADKAPADESPLLRRVRRKKPTHSFGCRICGKSFTRGADVKRHESSVHSPQPMDCPVENCVRKGSIGFPRRDHLMEHLRTFHSYDIPKRTGKRKAYAMLDDSF